MKKIQMVDLVGQYHHIKEEVDAAIHGVMESAAFINGPEVKQFQSEFEKYLRVRHVIPCANGTDALQMAMMALGLKPGDEVITSSFTFVATAEVIALLQLKPIVVDVDPDHFNIDIKSLERAITPNTKAIVPVHLFGQMADMESIMDLAKRHNLYVIEDACQAVGAEYTFSDGNKSMAGTIGDIGATSFFPSKNLGCFGDGGAIFTNNDDLAEKLRVIANHGMKVRYYHDAIGVNSRLDSIQAAVLRIKLRRLNEYNNLRKSAADFYDRAFSSNIHLKVPSRYKKSTHVFHQYTLVTSGIDRFALQDFLLKKDVPAMVYYPVPLHMQKAYLDDRYQEGDFPITEDLCKTVISLPMHTELDEEQLEYIASAVLEFVNKKT
jgi:UDP-2-acetamido-2-deoxy-ribo-hexuluronate aminotransferase